MKEIYLDNSATTRVFHEAADIMSRIMTEDFGNPSSMHMKGVEAEKYIRAAREDFARILKVSEKEIIFTSCGSESDNMAIAGAARANMRRGKHLITTAIEHPAVMNTMKMLEEEGFSVTYLATDDKGRISLEELKNAVTDETILVSIMHINNEIGSVEPIEEAGALIKSINPNILFHVDAVQSFGKIRIYPKRMNIDMLSISGHKIHGPKGMGVLYINEKVKVRPLIYGGGQQNNLRSGTENVPGIAGMAKAATLIFKNFDEDVRKLYRLKKKLVDGVSSIEGVSVNGLPGYSVSDATDISENMDLKELSEIFGAPHVISVSIRDIRAEVMLHALEDKGIYVSAGSACSTHKRTPSATLTVIGLEKSLLESTIRLSTGIFNSEEEIDETVSVMREIIPGLRKYTRR